MTDRFDDIRPYREDEIPAAMKRIANCEVFPILASYIFPEETVETVRKRIAAYTTVRDFQLEVMHRVNEKVINSTITELTCTGLERLDPGESYLYVSNHRDIMLDAALLQQCLVDNGFDTNEISFGANLMMNQTVIDIGKANKMFRVERPGGSAREFYKSSRHLSDYIRHVITEKHQSLWIAQRNGRTKDGNDATDQGIVKMFCMSMPEDKIAALADLHIVPVAVSYEWETCDILKTLELYQSSMGPYTKKPGEDLTSIISGILQHKGRVHIEICKPISYEVLATMESLTAHDYYRAVASLLDTRINSAYRLYPNNFIAHDIRYGSRHFSSHYTAAQKAAFLERMSGLDRYDAFDIERLKEIFLGIYSNSINGLNV